MHTPSTKDLRAFEIVARLGSIKAAAEHMHLTPSALSRRIQSLEEELGQALFIRDARGLTLTEAGHNYANQLRDIFQALDEATSALSQNQRQRLRIVAPSSVMTIIAPKLCSFEQNMPDIDLELHEQTAALPSDLNIPDADLVISWGEGRWPGWTSRYISPNSHITPLCVPQLLKDGCLMSTEEVSQHAWIVATPFEDAWKRWYGSLGVPLPKPPSVIKVSNGKMAGEAAFYGRGLLMGHGFGGFPNLGILFSTLTCAHGFHALTPGFGYHLHTQPQANNPAIARFRRWFFSEVWCATALQKSLEMFQKHQAT